MRTFSEQEFEDFVFLCRSLKHFVDIASDAVQAAQFELSEAGVLAGAEKIGWAVDTLSRTKSGAHEIVKELSLDQQGTKRR